MQTLNTAELTFLSILAYPKLTAAALKLYAGHNQLFTATFCPHLAMMWDKYTEILGKHKKEHGLRLSKDIIAAEFAEVLQADQDMPQSLLEHCDILLQKLTKDDVPTFEEGKTLLQQLATQAAKRRIGAKVTMNADLLELQRTLDASVKAVSELEDQQAKDVAARSVLNPFRDMPSLAVRADRIPTGINWLDEVTSGGGRAGELWLILGSSGGGKTTCAVQYACAQALMGNATLWATYEQSLEGDIAERIISCVTDVSLDKIRDVGFNNLPEEVQNKFWACVAGADEKLIVLDMTKVAIDRAQDRADNGGMYSVWKQYKQLKEHGVQVKTIIIDWIGAMMSLVGSVSNKDLANGYRFATQAEIDIARKMVKEEGIQIIFFHQTDSKSQHARPVYVPDKTCAKDMKDMCNYMDIVLTLGTRDINDVCWISAAKSRKGAAITKTIQLIGDKCRFVPAPGWLPNRDGNFYRPGEGFESDDTPVEKDVASSYSREIE